LAVDVLGTVRPLRREFSGGWIGAKDNSAVTQAGKRLEAQMWGDRQLARFYDASGREMSKVKT
jgi:hypothetical protein